MANYVSDSTGAALSVLAHRTATIDGTTLVADVQMTSLVTFTGTTDAAVAVSPTNPLPVYQPLGSGTTLVPAAINTSTNNATLVAGVSSKRIYVVSLFFTVSAATAVGFTIGGYVVPPMPQAANDGMVAIGMPQSPLFWEAGATGSSLTIQTTAQVTGNLVYFVA